MTTLALVFGIIGALCAVGFGAFAWAFYRRLSSAARDAGEDQSFLMLQNQLNEMRRTLDARLHESVEAMKKQAEEMIRVGETSKRVGSVADQLKNFENILKNPKQRGILGEYFLETVLKNVLPPNAYEIQHTFADGEIVDAVIITKEGKIPIDSKFSLENYNRIIEEQDPARREELEKLFRQDLKKRIDETSKYIRPREGTLDFAFMFIPHEAIYYDLLVSQVGAVTVNTRDLIDYALKEKRVIIVSPTTFYAYLQTILQGLRALKIEESAK
ncbi:MAG: DNA recombination protein RmuC, partial [Candidatus Liptonbacteria bacterium]|nr:DNA recombination protein RmuC [Candidatus Liptonbacteria bacterium]